jgi:hypothetical protein
MNTYKEIANEDTIDYLVERIGRCAAFYDINLFDLLRKFAGDIYDGGLWVVREYPNGAFAYIFPEDTIIPNVNHPNMQNVQCSLEAASYAANLFVLTGLAERLIKDGEEELAEKLLNYNQALSDALAGRMVAICDLGRWREPTPEELALPREIYPERAAVQAMID